jgi:nucleotide-binding universal stress UspA family protein
VRVLVALDFGFCSRLACEWVVRRRDALGVTTLVFHHVVDVRQPPEVTVLERGVADLHAFVTECVGAEVVGARFAVVKGQPAQEIVEAARFHRIDTIVMGTHGRTGIDRLLLGSVAESVTRHAPCTVVIVKPGPFSKEPE